ncbi:hypothetical protein BT69DRAFT_1351687 [Atractiella rhizophila]|nr:hypothetical protein BT69DRAFT_1351687 [Atractiella rhizophila]
MDQFEDAAENIAEGHIEKSILHFNSNITQLTRLGSSRYESEDIDIEKFKKNVVKCYLILDKWLHKLNAELWRIRNGWEHEQSRNTYGLILYFIFWYLNLVPFLLCLLVCYHLTPIPLFSASHPTILIDDADSGIGSEDSPTDTSLPTPCDRANALAAFLSSLLPQTSKRTETPTNFTTFQPRTRRSSLQQRQSLTSLNSPLAAYSSIHSSSTLSSPVVSSPASPTFSSGGWSAMRRHQQTASTPQTAITRPPSWIAPSLRRSDSTPPVRPETPTFGRPATPLQGRSTNAPKLKNRSMSISEAFGPSFLSFVHPIETVARGVIEVDERLSAVLESSQNEKLLEREEKEEWQWKLEDLMREENISDLHRGRHWSKDPKTVLSLAVFASGLFLVSVGLRTISKVAFAFVGFWLFGKPFAGVWNELWAVIKLKAKVARLLRSAFPTQVQMSFRTIRTARKDGLSIFAVEPEDAPLCVTPTRSNSLVIAKSQTSSDDVVRLAPAEEILRKRRSPTLETTEDKITFPTAHPERVGVVSSAFLDVQKVRPRNLSVPGPARKSESLSAPTKRNSIQRVDDAASDDEREKRWSDMLDEASQRLHSTTDSFYCQHNNIPGNLVLSVPLPRARTSRRSKATLSFVPGIASSQLPVKSATTSKSLSHGRRRSSRHILQSLELDLEDVVSLKKLDEGMGEEGLEVTTRDFRGDTVYTFNGVKDRDDCFLRMAVGVDKKWDIEQ